MTRLDLMCDSMRSRMVDSLEEVRSFFFWGEKSSWEGVSEEERLRRDEEDDG